MSYEVIVVGCDDLPAGQDWALVEDADDARQWLLVKMAPDPLGPAMMAQVAEAATLLDAHRPMSVA